MDTQAPPTCIGVDATAAAVASLNRPANTRRKVKIQPRRMAGRARTMLREPAVALRQQRASLRKIHAEKPLPSLGGVELYSSKSLITRAAIIKNA